MRCAGVTVLYNPDYSVVESIKTYIDDVEILFLVDNSSKDNSKMFSFDKKIRYIPFLDNKGISYALNYGAKKAIELGFEWLLTMDQDSQFDKSGLGLLLDYISKDYQGNKVGLYSPFHSTAISGEPPKETVSNPLVLMTSGNVINLRAYKEIEGFKDWMFIDCVDFDYCLNLRIHGYELVQVNDVILNHKLGDYEVKKFRGRDILCDNHNATRRYYIVRNSYYIYDMYHQYYPDYCTAVVREVQRAFFYVPILEKDGFKKLVKMIKGYIDFRLKRKGRLNQEVLYNDE